MESLIVNILELKKELNDVKAELNTANENNKELKKKNTALMNTVRADKKVINSLENKIEKRALEQNI